MRWQLEWGVPGGLTTALVLAAALSGLVIWSALQARAAGVSPRTRRLLTGLRGVSALALWLLAVQPSWWGERVSRQEGTIAVLLDRSASMGVGEPSRMARAAALVERWRRAAGAARARFYTFGDRLDELAPDQAAAEVPATAGRTALWEALRQLTEQQAGLGAVAVISDGADTTGAPPPERLDARLHAIVAGDQAPLRDDSIVALHADPVAFLRSEGRVQARVRSGGLGDHRATVKLVRQPGGGSPRRVVDERTLRLKDGAEQGVELRFEPAGLGRELYALELEVSADDDVPSNNRRAFIVRVTRDRLRVLHVSGRPSWDQRFLRGFLKRDPSIDLISFFILRSTFDLPNSDQSEMALIPFPTDELFRDHLDSFDVVILQNFNFGPYRMEQHLPRIASYVRKGGALAMLGGDLSFEAGGYATTPIAQVLPVQLEQRDEGQPALVKGAFRPQLVRALRRHPVLELHPDPRQNLAVWASLEPLRDAHRFLGLRAGGYALLVHPTERVGQGRLPVLATGRFGEGRSLALGTDSSWHWSMPTAAAGGDPAVYDRFWDRALRWLARDPLLDPAQLSTDAEAYAPGARVQVRGVARGADYQPLPAKEVKLSVKAARGGRARRVPFKLDRDGNLRAHFEAPAKEGVYRVRLRRGGKQLTQIPFLVERGGQELADPRPSPDALERLARQSGGVVRSVDDAPELASLDASRTRTLGAERRAPFASAWLPGVVGLFLCLEWWVRRRLGAR